VIVPDRLKHGGSGVIQHGYIEIPETLEILAQRRSQRAAQRAAEESTPATSSSPARTAGRHLACDSGR
jgi:hypothetical protein